MQSNEHALNKIGVVFDMRIFLFLHSVPSEPRQIKKQNGITAFNQLRYVAMPNHSVGLFRVQQHNASVGAGEIPMLVTVFH